jgi:3-mercaptopyruvate sulfurtransferase SseA
MLKDPDRATRLVESLPALLAEHGVDPTRPVITHCQSHHRSGLSYMVGRLLGFANIRAYHGSWGEWGNRDDLPIET